jgi:hypothetical protein
MKAGTLRVTSFGRGGFPPPGSPEAPFVRREPPSRQVLGEEDAEFTEEKPGR